MRLEENQYLFNQINHYLCVNINHLSVSSLLNAIRDSKLALQVEQAEGSVEEADKCVEEIGKAIPALRRIVSQPRSFIKTIEEKSPVATAKKINNKAISHLSRNSNDWQTRTFLTVVPKNILSDNNEETIDIYENRFIISLIDHIAKRISDIKIDLQDKIGKATSELASVAVERLLQGNYAYRTKGKLVKDMDKYNINCVQSNYVEKANKKMLTIVAIEKSIRTMKGTAFYSSLRRCKRLRNPIQKSNIIMFDQNYNMCYKLWIVLQKQNIEEDVNLQALPDVDYCALYYNYVVINLIAALYDSDYEIECDCSLSMKENYFDLGEALIFKKNDVSVIINIGKQNEIIVEYSIDEIKQKNKTIIFTDYSDFEEMTKIEIADKSTQLIAGMVQKSRKKQKALKAEFASKYTFVSLNMNKCSESGQMDDKVYKRFYSIGDNYHEREENIREMSDYKTGMVIISPSDYKSNFLRIKRIINSNVLRLICLDKMVKICPICGSELKELGDNDFCCYNCKHRISLSNCNHCHNKEFLWIRYDGGDKIFKNEEVTKNFDGLKYYESIVKNEVVMGEYAISAFNLVKDENKGWGLKSICPTCGRQLGNS